ncbi:sulfotransferase [Alphaproteobacteria bacterium]|nr:sulfotransferase [Alphaproteobacteria bacterium]
MSDLGCLPGIRPLFISGVYRSGTTFLTALINAHPRFQTASSSVKFLRFCAGLYGNMSKLENRTRLITDTHKRVRTRWDLDFLPSAVEASLKQLSYAGVYDSIMRQMLRSSLQEGVEWAEKLAVQWDRIEDFLTMFPDGKVLHIIRDPRDVAASYKAMTYEPWPTFLDAAFNSLHAMQTLNKLSKRGLADRLLVIRAEDLARKTEEEVAKICDFLGVESHPAMFDIEQYSAIAGEDWKTNTSFATALKGFPDGEPRWPNHLERAEIIFIEMVCQPEMARYGYEGSGLVTEPEDMRAMAIFFDDTFIQQRFAHYLKTGCGSIGYRTDPRETELSIVFPDQQVNTEGQ